MSDPDLVQDPATPLDALVVGAGVCGIYQLYRLQAMGLSVALYDDAPAVGGTWFWNRYPGARFDSESYSYGYFFDKELLQEWDWTELFAGQPEIEKYLNLVVDRLGLRPLMHFNSRVTAATFDDSEALWAVTLGTGETVRTKYLVTAVGALSTPFIPDIPNRELFQGQMHHTGRWPLAPVDFKDKKVAVIGTGSSGIQMIPIIAQEVESLTVFQRTANWATPLHNRPISPAEMAEIKASYPEIHAKIMNQAIGLPHDPPDPRSALEVTEEERLKKYQEMWETPSLRKVFENFKDTATDPRANALFCEFIANKVRSLVHDPEVAELLIPKGHGFGGKRPPMEDGYYEAFNRKNVTLVDMRANPIQTFTEQGLQTLNGDHYEFDIIVLATGFDFSTGSLLNMNIRGRDGVSLADAWKDGPYTLFGIMVPGFPNLLIANGPHGTVGNPRATGVQVDWISDLISFSERQGRGYVEAAPEAADAYTRQIYETAADANHRLAQTASYFNGSNIPGKPKAFLSNTTQFPAYRQNLLEVADKGYPGVLFAKPQRNEGTDDVPKFVVNYDF